jgi:hypothetical protein
MLQHSPGKARMLQGSDSGSGNIRPVCVAQVISRASRRKSENPEAARHDEVQSAAERREEVQTTGGGGGGGRLSGEAQSAAENDEPIDEALIHGISVWADAASSEVTATGTKRRRSRSSSSGSLPLAR